MDSNEADISARLRQMQIIAAGLLFGPLLFAGIAVLLGRPAQGTPVVAYVMALLVMVQIPAFFFVPGLALQRQSGSAGTVAQELQKYQTGMIIRYALCEGAAFANLVAYIADGQLWSLAIAGTLWLVMLLMFPTRTQIDQWLEARQMDFNAP